MNRNEMEKLFREPLFDGFIVRHGFAPYMRDYDVIVQIGEQQFLFRFTHCVFAKVETSVRPEIWQESWDDVFTNNEAYETAGAPEGYFWDVGYSLAYPGARLIDGSEEAREWSRRLGKEMLDVRIETNAQNIDLVFHELRFKELLRGDPECLP